MSKVIKLSDEIIAKLGKYRHKGQSYNGVIQELLDRLEELEAKQNPK